MSPEYFSPDPKNRRACREMVLDSGHEKPVLFVVRQPKTQEDPFGPHTPAFLRNPELPRYGCYFGWVHSANFTLGRGIISLANYPHDTLVTKDSSPTIQAFQKARDHYPGITEIPMSDVLAVDSSLGLSSLPLTSDNRIGHDLSSNTEITGIDLGGLVELAYIDRSMMHKKVLDSDEILQSRQSRLGGIGGVYAFSLSRLQDKGVTKEGDKDSDFFNYYHVRGNLLIRPAASDIKEAIYLSFLQEIRGVHQQFAYISRDGWKTFLNGQSSLAPIAARTLLQGAQIIAILEQARKIDQLTQ